MLSAILAALCYQHAVFAKESSVSLLRMWKPVVISVKGTDAIEMNSDAVSDHIRARILLESPGSFAVATLGERGLSMCVCTLHAGQARVEAELWAVEHRFRKQAIRASVRRWCAEAIPHAPLVD